MARSNSKIWFAIGLAAVAAVVSVPIWGMGAAVFVDSDRTVLSRVLSQDHTHVAQLERLVVGGAPSIVVTVRPVWLPSWYLLECVAASHYQETTARVAWVSNRSLTVTTNPAEARAWRTDGAAFHPSGCHGFSANIVGLTAP